ncbi:MAG: di-trans,poly-cis-decaprenylcistransferase [Gammaproteobacteria bacterium]|nr:di-trans,poly-cis-decaprenylcistransferase [Gammaproteobacteria bacterium]|tara:strand:- start:161251 stop:161985 length:735 start_codon:yes stop_codon:yes gene_type:complete
MSSVKAKLPRHVAIIMDGNNRWAKKQNNTQLSGHRAGAVQARAITNYCADLSIEFLTLFVFSSENWLRPKKEVNALMALFLTVLQRQEINKLHSRNIRIKFIGDRQRFPKKLRDQMQAAEELTAKNSGLIVNVAANYGGRWDVMQAAKKLAAEVQDNSLQINDIDESQFQQYISMGDVPDPDLCIRTGGEQRISNFLLWQFAYTELYFTEVYWPDFDEKQMDLALADFARRQRRYGKASEQLES